MDGAKMGTYAFLLILFLQLGRASLAHCRPNTRDNHMTHKTYVAPTHCQPNIDGGCGAMWQLLAAVHVRQCEGRRWLALLTPWRCCFCDRRDQEGRICRRATDVCPLQSLPWLSQTHHRSDSIWQHQPCDITDLRCSSSCTQCVSCHGQTVAASVGVPRTLASSCQQHFLWVVRVVLPL